MCPTYADMIIHYEWQLLLWEKISMNILVFLKCMFELNQKENNIVITLLVVNNVKITRRILNIYNNRSCHFRNRTQGDVKTLCLNLYCEFCECIYYRLYVENNLIWLNIIRDIMLYIKCYITICHKY